MDKAGNGDIIGLVGQLVGFDMSDSMQRHRNLEVSQVSGNSHHLVTIDGTPGHPRPWVGHDHDEKHTMFKHSHHNNASNTAQKQ